MSRLMIVVSILIVAAGAAVLSFTFTVTNASITTSGTGVSVSGPATLNVSGVGTDTGTFSASGSLTNVSGGNVTVPFTVTLGHGTFAGNMTFPEGVLVGSGSVSGSATITSGTGRYTILGNTTVSGSGFTGSVLTGGMLSFSISGTSNGYDFTFSVTNAPVTISGTSVFSGAASLILAGNSDTGTFSATGLLANNISGGNLTVPFTVTLGRGTITGNMTFPETALVNSGAVSGSATITGGTGGYAGLTSSTLTASGTVTGSVLSGGTLSFSVSGTVTTSGPAPPIITQIYNGSSRIPAGFSNSGITPSTLFAIEGSGLSDPAAPVVNQTTQGAGLPTNGLYGTTVSIVGSDGKTYTPGLYHALSYEIAGVVPAAVPTGTATFNVTYNGQSTSAQVQIVPYAYGFNTYDGNIAVATDAVTGAVIGPTNSATPGETLIFWGTGLGADPADSDTVYASNGGHTINTPFQFYFANVQVPPSDIPFEGSSVYPGVHIWGVTLPSNVPTGCFVSVAAVLGGNVVSNLPTLPIAANGGACQDPVLGITGSTAANIAGQTTVSSGAIFVAQTTSPGQNGAPTTNDSLSATFQTVSGGSVFGSGTSISMGSCSLSQINAATFTAPSVTGLNAGTLTATPPTGSPIALSNPSAGVYSALLTGTIPSSGTFAFSWTGASGTNTVGAGQVSVTLPSPLLSWTDQDAAATITRANGLNVTWTGGAAGTYISVSGTSASQSDGTSATYTCLFPQAALQGAVPPYVLGALPAGTGTTTVGNSTMFVPFTATGLNYGAAFSLISFSVNSTYN